MKVNNHSHIVLWIAIGCFMASCNSGVSPQDLQVYLNQAEHGLTKTKAFNELTFSLQYRPASLLLAQELSSLTSAESVRDSILAKKKAAYEQYEYYRFRVEGSNQQHPIYYGLTSQAEADTRRQFLTFQLRPFLQMICGGDTVGCAFAHMDQTHGLVPFQDIMFAFPACKEGTNRQVIIHETSYPVGKLKYTFKASDIQHIPTVHY